MSFNAIPILETTPRALTKYLHVCFLPCHNKVLFNTSWQWKKMLAVGIIFHPYPADLGRPEFRTRALTRLWQERMPAPESWLFGSFWGTLKWMVHSGPHRVCHTPSRATCSQIHGQLLIHETPGVMVAIGRHG